MRLSFPVAFAFHRQQVEGSMKVKIKSESCLWLIRDFFAPGTPSLVRTKPSQLYEIRDNLGRLRIRYISLFKNLKSYTFYPKIESYLSGSGLSKMTLTPIPTAITDMISHQIPALYRSTHKIQSSR